MFTVVLSPSTMAIPGHAPTEEEYILEKENSDTRFRNRIRETNRVGNLSRKGVSGGERLSDSSPPIHHMGNEQRSLNLIKHIYKTARSPYEQHEKPVFDIKKIKDNCFWGKKQKNAYNTILTGLKISSKMGKRIRFLTLTTSDIQFNNCDYDDRSLNHSFRKLKQRILRITVAKLVQQGYIKSSDIRRYYRDKPLNECFKLDYFKVITNEGNGVIHCLYKGEYLPYNYLVDNWQDIHNSWDINIKLIRNNKKDYRKSATYVVSQYVSNQESTFQRSSQSWKWIFRGYRKGWLDFLNGCRARYYFNPVQRRFYKNRMEVDIFSEWERIVLGKVKPPPFQVCFDMGLN